MQSHDGEKAAPDLSAVLAGASRGDEGAWRELTLLYGRRVFALVRSRVGSDDLAEEISQSVFATIAIKLRDGGYEEIGRFEPWLFRIAMNRVRDSVRHAKRRAGVLSLDASSEPVVERSQTGIDGADRAGLRAAVETLSEADREIIELRHHAGMGFRQMAELLGEPVGTLLARHHRALQKLKAMLAPSKDQESENTQ